jgi:hypothetical protein
MIFMHCFLFAAPNDHIYALLTTAFTSIHLFFSFLFSEFLDKRRLCSLTKITTCWRINCLPKYKSKREYHQIAAQSHQMSAKETSLKAPDA